MGRLLRRLGIFDGEEDSRWQEEHEFEKRAREDQDRRYRQYRCELLFWRLWGVDQADALKIAEGVWGFPMFDHQSGAYPDLRWVRPELVSVPQ